MKLFRKFWPTCPYDVRILTDFAESYADIDGFGIAAICQPASWCEIVSAWANRQDELGVYAVMLTQEDLLINAPVNELLIVKGLEQLQERNAAMVRLYPCPGGDIPYGDKWYAEIPKGTKYRVSCLTTLWRPQVLAEIASNCETPADFEIKGSELSNDYMEPFLAFRRDVTPWPISHYTSAISRGKWSKDALEFCKQQGIEVDLSMREVA